MVYVCRMESEKESITRKIYVCCYMVLGLPCLGLATYRSMKVYCTVNVFNFKVPQNINAAFNCTHIQLEGCN